MVLLENSGNFQKLQLLHHCGSDALCSNHLVCCATNCLFVILGFRTMSVQITFFQQLYLPDCLKKNICSTVVEYLINHDHLEHKHVIPEMHADT